MQKRKITPEEKLVDLIIEGILRKKGKEIVKLNFSKIENAVCQYFIICHGDSRTQVTAIAESVEDIVEETIKEKVWHKEGYDNAHWVLLDYALVVVHVFQQEYRDYYKLESLWADAESIEIKEN